MRKLIFALVYICLSLFAIVYATTSVITSGSKKIVPVIHEVERHAIEAGGKTSLKLISFNIAHGRKLAFNQITLNKLEIQSNLKEIATFLKRENPDLVALQEADGRSFWSQNFNHVKYLAYYAGFRYSMHGMHVNGAGIRFGTAVLSQLEPDKAYTFTFNPSPPTFAKGFTVATIEWPGKSDMQVDFISVHLDYSRESVRTEQINDLISYVKTQKRPFIIMGDFNIDWSKQSALLQDFLRRTGAKTYQATNDTLVTFPARNQRIDWIFVSPEFDIESHKIVNNGLSDHYALVATVVIHR